MLDTSAILALRSDESGAERVAQILRAVGKRHPPALISFMSRMELLYLITRDENEAAAAETVRLLNATPVEWVSCEPEILDVAARLKATGNLSVADAWIAATAVERGATLVHKDPEFRHVPGLQQEELLLSR